MRFSLSVFTALCVIATISAQSAEPTFEVASVRRTSPDDSCIAVSPGYVLGNRWMAECSTLLALIRTAHRPDYQLPDQIVGGPEWLRSDRFNINAVIEGAPEPSRVQSMARALLSERFKLVTHVEQRQLEVFDLVFARGDHSLGPKIRPAGVDCSALRAAQRRGEAAVQVGRPGNMPACVTNVTVAPRSRIESGGMTMAELASRVSQAANRPVFDGTGMSGDFALLLEFTWEQARSFGSSSSALSGNAATDPAELPFLSVALQSQLGLTLRGRRASLGVLVIDSAQQPTEN